MSVSRSRTRRTGSERAPGVRPRRSAWDWFDLLLLGPGARDDVSDSDMQAAALSASAGFPSFPSYRRTPARGDGVASDNSEPAL